MMQLNLGINSKFLPGTFFRTETKINQSGSSYERKLYLPVVITMNLVIKRTHLRNDCMMFHLSMLCCYDNNGSAGYDLENDLNYCISCTHKKCLSIWEYTTT